MPNKPPRQDECVIEWRDGLPRAEWEEWMAKCPHSTLLQSYAYAQAVRAVHKQTARHGLISINGREAGIVQMQEVGLFNRAIHAMSVDRGPLWFKNFGNPAHIRAFVAALDADFPTRMGRKRRFIPECTEGKGAPGFMQGWTRKPGLAYSTILWDLTRSADDIRAGMRQTWRHALVKAEKADLRMSLATGADDFARFMNAYARDRIARRYAGASPRFLTALAAHAGAEGYRLYQADEGDGEVIAAILVFLHGCGATYQTGWTTPYGRTRNAHHFLLWRAALDLKDAGITHFDLGGYNAEAEGIRLFKAGTGGHTLALIGTYH